MHDKLGAFCNDRKVQLKGSEPGPLSGLTFAAKDVFDIAGARVGVGLAPTRNYSPGHHSITFDGSNLSSGIYIYHLTAGEYTGVGKMVLMK